MVGSLSNGHAPALIDRAKLDFRDMREVGGFVIRSDASHSNGSARFARSLTARDKDFARDTHDFRCVALPDLVG